MKRLLSCSSHVSEHDIVEVNGHEETPLDGVANPLLQPDKCQDDNRKRRRTHQQRRPEQDGRKYGEQQQSQPKP